MNAMTTQITGLAEEVGKFAAGVDLDELPAGVIEQLLSWLDYTLGISRAGFGMVQPLSVPYVSISGGSGSTQWVAGTAGGAEHVAFANAMAAHARGQDDFLQSAQLHGGAVIVPAVLAMAELLNSPGRDVVAALAVGYQVGGALAAPATTATGPRGLRGTPIFGPLAAAAACARLAGATPHQLAVAIGLAAQSGSGFNQPNIDGTSEWRLQPAMASQSGVRSARLAMLGAQASPFTLEGAAGFYAAICGADVDPDSVIRAVRGDWLMSQTRIKALPVCGMNQGPAASAIALFEDERRAVDFASVRLELRSDEIDFPGIAGRGPFSGPGAALMSSAYVVSTALLTGTVTWASLERPPRDDIMELTARVELARNDDLPELGNVLTTVTADGRRRSIETIMPSGELDREIRRGILQRVAEEIADPRVASDAREAAVLALPDAPSVVELITTV